MNFDVDKQTLDDLSIFQNTYNRNSIFNLFNHTKTIGGKEKLEEIFNRPLTNPTAIKDRIDVINYFQNNNTQIAFDKVTCDFIEFYLKKNYRAKSFAKFIGFIERIIYAFNSNNDYYVIQQGVASVLEVLSTLFEFIKNDIERLPKLLKDFHITISKIFDDGDFNIVKQLINKKKLSVVDLIQADHLFRHIAYDKIYVLLDIIYQLDVYIAVSLSGKAIGFNLPVINENSGSILVLKDLFHPFINNHVGNNIEFNYNKNVCFVTGANMAGKSTFLKAVGVSVYLSQLGFPVPATYMETSVFKGLITTINIADDIHKGHSHFYNEVLRVKHVAEKINESSKIFVIFDELFRGTNVKDAYDASLAIIAAFSKVRKCFFIVSTHIVEVANDLSKINNVDFRYMETLFDKDNPVYSYKLKEGITEERLGMWIVKNEKIVEIIENSIKQ